MQFRIITCNKTEDTTKIFFFWSLEEVKFSFKIVFSDVRKYELDVNIVTFSFDI